MDWKEMIAEGMRLIKEGCLRNSGLCGEHCPFNDFCFVLWQEDKDIPIEWKVEK